MKNMRLEMPDTAEAIDDLRIVFGKELINRQIKDGISGMPTFYAIEGDIDVGTQATNGTKQFEIDGADFLRIWKLCRDNHDWVNTKKGKRNE